MQLFMSTIGSLLVWLKQLDINEIIGKQRGAVLTHDYRRANKKQHISNANKKQHISNEKLYRNLPRIENTIYLTRMQFSCHY